MSIANIYEAARNKASSSIFGRNKGKYKDFGVSEYVSGFHHPGNRSLSDATDRGIDNYINSNQRTYKPAGGSKVESWNDGSSNDDGIQEAPRDLGSIFSGSGGGGQSEAEAKREARKRIGSGWDEADDSLGSAGSWLKKMQKDIKKLPKVRERYDKAAQGYLARTKEAIQGNRDLISNEQDRDMKKIAKDTRGDIFGTNLQLGTLGASNSSAARMAGKAIAREAGRGRKEILEYRGTQQAEQDQAEKNAVDQYKLRIQQSKEWEERELDAAEEEYESMKEALDKLKGRKSRWREEDIEAMEDRNLQKLFSKVNDIVGQVAGYRSKLDEAMYGLGFSAEEIEAASIEVNPPAELLVPDFTDELTFEPEEEAEDFYNPKKKGKKEGEKDIFGNTLDEEEQASA